MTVISNNPTNIKFFDGSFDWDNELKKHSKANLFASEGWGDYKKNTGWTTQRIIVRNKDGCDLGFIQYQQRKKGPMRFIFAQGCPILTNQGVHQAREVFQSFTDHLRLGRFDLLAIKYYHFECHASKLALLANNFHPVISAEDHTLEVDLSLDIKVLRANLDARWRNGLLKAERNDSLEAKFITDSAEKLQAFDEFDKMYASLKNRKGFTSSLSTELFRNVVAHNPYIKIQQVREKGNPILVRIVHVSHHRWTDFFVASTERARVTEAARFALWRSIEKAQKEGVKIYDLGGIDQVKNRGVFVFKVGVTRCVAQSTPLWLHSRTPALRQIAAAFLRRG